MSDVFLKWIEGHLMMGVDSAGHTVAIGSASEKDPIWAGIKPSDMLLLAAASCSAYDVVTILKKQREPLEGLEVRCAGRQAAAPPHNFLAIHIHYVVRGAVDHNRLARAIELSERKYCSVINSLSDGVKVTSDFETLG